MAKTLAQGRKPGSGRKPGKGKTLREGRKPGSGRRRRNDPPAASASAAQTPTSSAPPTFITNMATLVTPMGRIAGGLGLGSPQNPLSEIQRFNANVRSSSNNNNNGLGTRVMDAVEALRDLTKSPNLGHSLQMDTTTTTTTTKRSQQTFIEVMPQGPYFSGKVVPTPTPELSEHIHEPRQNMHLDMHVRLPDRRLLSLDTPQRNAYVHQKPSALPSPQYQRSQ